MGFLKKIFRPIRKVAKKIIPKEVRPFLPYAAAFTPGLQGLAAAGGITNAAAQKALIAGLTSAATDEQGDPLRTALLAAAPDVLSQGLGSAGRMLGDANPESKFAQYLVSKGTGLEATLNNPGVMDMAKIGGAQASVDQAAKFAEINQDEIDKYNEELRKRGVLDKTKRRTSILNIYLNAGYEPDYVNSMLDRYGYESGGRIGFAEGLGIFEDEDILESISRGYKGSKAAMTNMFKKKKNKRKPKKIVNEKGDVYNIYTNEDDDETIRDNEFNDALMRAKEGIEMAYKTPGPKPVPMMKFSRGGEVEIEEETDDLDIMDFMRDQGIEYGEQASDINNERVLEQLYEEFLDMGLSPADAAKAARDAFDRMSRKEDNSGIMQMASGYKTDIEEMYEQYVFEMEEQGLQPMSFSDFLAQARSGMAKGGSVNSKRRDQMKDIKGQTAGPQWYQDRLEHLMDMGYSYEQAGDIAYDSDAYYNAIGSDPFKEGGKVKRRKKGEPEDEIIETEEEIFIDNMPRPKRQGIMEVADGGIMEKDMRGGGFIPEGTKEKADDVPARLSKNEFVMTADAVRAAGGGSVNKGAKRMYDMMYQLEGKV
jgi:hypothetical protein